MDADKHRYGRGKRLTRRVSQPFFRTLSDLCSSASICGFKRFFEVQPSCCLRGVGVFPSWVGHAALWVAAGCLASSICNAFGQASNSETNLLWRDARDLIIEGRGWPDTKDFYDRLPASAEKLVRQDVWNLGHDSAGMCVRFVTDATTISARWTLRRESLAMPHMPATGVSGLDLYVRGQGHWHWVGNGRPAKTVEEKVLVKGQVCGSTAKAIRYVECEAWRNPQTTDQSRTEEALLRFGTEPSGQRWRSDRGRNASDGLGVRQNGRRD